MVSVNPPIDVLQRSPCLQRTSDSQWPHFSLSLGFSTAQSAAAMEVPTGENEVLSYLRSNLFLRGLEIKTFFAKEDGGTNICC